MRTAGVRRKKPVAWPVVFRILKVRRQMRDMKAQGFVEVRSFSCVPWEANFFPRITEARIGFDGRSLWVRMEPGS